MPVKKSPSWAPLTFDLTQPQAAKIEMARRTLGFGTQSEVVRAAIGQFDFSSFEAKRPVERQISVRLAPELREKLRQHARRKNVSIGELLRVALERLVTAKAGSHKTSVSSKRRK